MKRSPKDYLQAFIQAVRLTLAGQKVSAPERYPQLNAWVDTALKLTDEAFAAAESAGLDEVARKSFMLTLEGRPISMDTILQAVRHNLTREYPLLLKGDISHHLTAFYAFNLNDTFRVLKLADSLDEFSVSQQAIKGLGEHLQAVPPAK